VKVPQEKWEGVKALFEAVLEQPLEARLAFLAASRCEEDVRLEVERLLQYHEQEEAEGFLKAADGRLRGEQEQRPVETFRVGDTLANRFRIVRFIARGGMGDVYEADDLELGNRVALKTIRQEVLRHSNAVDKFKQEVNLARRVTHPNVCRVFDLFRHRGSPSNTGDNNDVLLVTMELLYGETLAERLKRTGRLSLDEAGPIVRQMARALSAAHLAGVLHRDFKPGNVLMVSSREEDSLRAVVTDFGIAVRADQDTEASGSQISRYYLSGTPAYMSPEQLKGLPLTPASDIYSLGLVMFEMITGQAAFQGKTPVSRAIKRLNEKPHPPSNFVSGLDPVWESVILKCLEREPARRFSTAEEIPKALEREVILDPRRPKAKWLALTAIIFGFLILAGLSTWFAWHPWIDQAPRVSESGSAPTNLRRSVAVLGFRDLSGTPSVFWLSTAFSEWIASEVAAGEKLRVIPEEDVTRMKKELSLKLAEGYAQGTLDGIRMNLGTDLILQGSYALREESGEKRIRLDVKVQDAKSGDIVAQVAQVGNRQELLDLIPRVGSELREKLGMSALSPWDSSRLRASLPTNLEAAKLHAEGVTKERLYDFVAAAELFQRAVMAEPTHALGYSALARVQAALGYDQKARESAKRAFQLSKNMSRDEQLSVEALYREIAKDWSHVIDIYQTLWVSYPDNIDYGLELAAAQTKGGKAEDAFVTVEALRKLPPPLNRDPRIELADGWAAEALGDFKRELASVARAVQIAEAQGARLIVARAKLLQSWAYDNLSNTKDAISAAEEAKQIYASVGDRGGVARALKSLGDALGDQGNYEAAKKAYNESLLIFRETGYRAGEAIALSNMAIVCRNQGDLARASQLYSESLTVSREIGDKSGVVRGLLGLAGILWRKGDLAGAKRVYEEGLEESRLIGNKVQTMKILNNIGNVLMDQSSFEEARKVYEESLALARESDNNAEIAEVSFNIGALLSNQGRLVDAEKAYQESLAKAKQIEDKSQIAYTLFGLGELQAARGDLTTARKTHEEALALRKAMGEKLFAAESQTALALVLIEQGDPSGAESLARESVAAFHDAKAFDGEAPARAALALALAEQGKTRIAEIEIGNAKSVSQKTESEGNRLVVAITAARIQAGSDNPFQWEEAQGEIEIKSGRKSQGRARLTALEKEALAKGFGLIARKAVAALRGQENNQTGTAIVQK
jgi:serine/threonine protein kinase/tetratricopeptide (TPR) repeat protein